MKKNIFSNNSQISIGVLGGTFDPVHNGHLALANAAKESGLISELWFLPNPLPPHKTLQSNSASVEDRLAMLKLITEESFYKVSDYEITHEGGHYTYETLSGLEKLYPEYRFCFIIGADSLFQIETWKKPEAILPGRKLLAAVRGDHDYADIIRQIEFLNRKYNSEICGIRMNSIDVSSTEIRERAAKGESLKGLVPSLVEDYIRKRGLYR